MYRYRDARGLTRQLADDAELRVAIAQGEVRAGTPFADEDGAWTVASMHPAYQAASKGVKPVGAGARAGSSAGASGSAGAGFLGVDWGRLTKSAAGRLGILALTAAITFVAFRDQRVSKADAERYVRELTAALETDPMPAHLAEPPKARSLRAAWAIMMASRDVGRQMDASRVTVGFADEPPAAWLSNAYLVRPGNYPEVAAHWRGGQQFHQLWRDSLLARTEAAFRVHAERAGITGKRLDAAANDFLGPMAGNVALHATGIRMAEEAMNVHLTLMRAEGQSSIDFSGNFLLPNNYLATTFNNHMANFEQHLAAIDSMSGGYAQASAALTDPGQ